MRRTGAFPAGLLPLLNCYLWWQIMPHSATDTCESRLKNTFSTASVRLWMTCLKGWKIKGRGGQRRTERESSSFRYRIHLFSVTGLSRGIREMGGGADGEKGNSGLIENICAVQNGCSSRAWRQWLQGGISHSTREHLLYLILFLFIYFSLLKRQLMMSPTVCLSG